MVADSKRYTLNDEPAYVDIVVQQQTAWNRTLEIKNKNTGVVRNLQGRSFIGDIREAPNSPVVTSFVYTINPDNSFTVSLSKTAILLLDLTKIYIYDMFLIELNGLGEKIMTGTIQSVYSVTTVP